MIRKLFISTAICSALISSPVLATGNTDHDQDNPQTTGQQRSGPNDAGGQASTSRSTNADQASATNRDQSNRQRFNDMDRNGDGRLDEEELNRYGSTAAGREQNEDSDRGERLLEMYDQNDDDELTHEELERGPRSEHEENDSDWW